MTSGTLEGPHQHQHQNLELSRLLRTVGSEDLGYCVPLGNLVRVEEVPRIEECWKTSWGKVTLHSLWMKVL